MFGYLVEIGVETTFGQKTACSDMVTFPQILTKITDFEIWKGFDGSLEHPNIWISEHLNRKTNYGSHPMSTDTF